MKLHRFLSIYYAQMITHFVFLCLAEGLLYIFDVNVFLMINYFSQVPFSGNNKHQESDNHDKTVQNELSQENQMSG